MFHVHYIIVAKKCFLIFIGRALEKWLNTKKVWQTLGNGVMFPMQLYCPLSLIEEFCYFENSANSANYDGSG